MKGVGVALDSHMCTVPPGESGLRNACLQIMRRVLRKVASKEEDQLGDTSTLADPGVIAQLVELRGK